MLRSFTPLRARSNACGVPGCIHRAVDEVIGESGALGYSCRSHIPTFGVLDDSYWHVLDAEGGQEVPATRRWRAAGGVWDKAKSQVARP